MKPNIAILATLSLFASVPAALAQTKAPEAPKEAAGTPVKEADYAKGVLGTWRQEIKQGPMVGHAISTYTEDGKTSSVLNMSMEGQDKKIEVTAKAKWSIEKNKMTVEILESSMPAMMPPGMKLTQTIISLSDKEFIYKEDSTGQQITEKRVKPDEKKPAEEEKPGKK